MQQNDSMNSDNILTGNVRSLKDDVHLDEISVVTMVSGVPLLDALQVSGNNKSSVGPLVPPRRKSRDGSVDKKKASKVSLENQAPPEIR